MHVVYFFLQRGKGDEARFLKAGEEKCRGRPIFLQQNRTSSADGKEK